MFDIGWTEVLMILLVAAVVIGPKDLPRAMHSAGKLFRKFKMFTGDIQKSLDRIMHEEELNDIMREANKPGGDNLQFEIERKYAQEQQRKAALESPVKADKEDQDVSRNN